MDSLTHVLFGATLAQTGFRRRLGRRAIAAAILTASLPDFDVVAAWIEGRFAEWEYHRAGTHSLLFAIVVGPLLGWIVAKTEQRWARSPAGTAVGDDRTRSWVWLSFLALLSHPILDVFTSYGTQILWPLTSRRFAVDAVAIIDPFFSLLPLAIALIVGARWPTAARRAALAVYVYMAVYVVVAWQLNLRIERVAAADFGRPAEIRAYPLLLQPYYRRVTATTPDAVDVGYYSLLNPKPIAWQDYPIDRTDASAAVRRTREGVLFQWFAMGQVLWRAAPDGQGGTLVEASDLRYGMRGPSDTGNWGIRARLDAGGHVVEGPHPYSAPRDTSGAALRQFWSDLTGR